MAKLYGVVFGEGLLHLCKQAIRDYVVRQLI